MCYFLLEISNKSDEAYQSKTFLISSLISSKEIRCIMYMLFIFWEIIRDKSLYLCNNQSENRKWRSGLHNYSQTDRIYVNPVSRIIYLTRGDESWLVWSPPRTPETPLSYRWDQTYAMVEKHKAWISTWAKKQKNPTPTPKQMSNTPTHVSHILLIYCKIWETWWHKCPSAYTRQLMCVA